MSAVAEPLVTDEGQAPAAPGTETPPAPVATPPAEPKVEDETPALPEKFTFGEEGKGIQREIGRATRELQRIQKALEDRKAELAGIDGPKPATSAPRPAPQPKATPADEGDPDEVITFHGMEMTRADATYWQSLEGQVGSAHEGLQQTRQRLHQMENADLEADAAENEAVIKTQLRSAVTTARERMIPGLEAEQAEQVDLDAWRDFEEALNEAADRKDTDAFSPERLEALLSDIMLRRRKTMTALGWKQIRANRDAAVSQPSLTGPSAVPAGKDISQMTPEELEADWSQRSPLKGKIQFTD